jgi:hypothetical protein
MNKKGNYMDIALPLLTLFMCGIVIFLYFESIGSLNASLVSPAKVLEASDEAFFFEFEEKKALYDLYCDDINAQAISSQFCIAFNSFEHKKFLTGSALVGGTAGITSSNFCNTVYSFVPEGNNVRVSRTGAYTTELLISDNVKQNFNMIMNFTKDKQYLLTKEDCN